MTDIAAHLLHTKSLVHIELEAAHVFLANKHLSVSGSDAVRALLRLALDRLAISDVLDQGSHPYRLKHTNKLVSFSHSRQRIAVCIAKTQLHGLGVDIEDNKVSMKVATRFFSDQEVAWLNTLTPKSQQQATNLLWMAKESHIKAQGSSESLLLKGLSVDILTEFPYVFSLIDSNQKKPFSLQNVSKTHWLFTNHDLSFAVITRCALFKKQSSFCL